MADRRIGNSSMVRKRGRPRKETGTCNVCYAPCSSCMHRNTAKSFTGSKSDESSSEASNVVSKEAKSQLSELSGNVSGKGKVKEKSGAENNSNKDKKNSLSESSIDSDQSGKSGENNSLSNKAEEPNTSAMSESENKSESENESADSEMLELDVKVCDICGDAGREDLLAICSRCSDGAEHTYCMRVMLKKVPEGDWLCEECKFAEEADKKKLEIKARREAEANSNTQSSNKRQLEKSEAAPDAKRQAVEAPIGSPKKSSLPRLAPLSRETSFKGVEKPTRKLAHHSSFNSHSSDDTESTPSSDSQLQSSKGSFLKSNSFNASSSRHSKVRPVDDVMLTRQKTGKEDDVKEGSSRNVDKSTSTRGNSSTSHANSGRDLKSDGKQGTKQGRHQNRSRVEDTVASVGDVSTNEKSSSSEQASSEAKRKDADGNRQLPGSKAQNAEPGNRLRAAVDAALRKKPSFGKNRGLDQSELPSVANKVDTCSDNKVPSKVSVTRDWPVGLQRTDKPTIAMVPSQSIEPEAVKPFVRDWPVGLQRTEKQPPLAASQSVEPEVRFPVVRDFPVVAASTILSTTSAIPEPEYMWQGDLEVQRSSNQSVIHSGIHAYLSTLASPKVSEVVKNQFPVKLTLNEVSRLSAWPTQFQDNGAKEEHVALFFFAKDIESYGKSYKPLVDNMIQKDLALQANLEGVELLIFASNQLPQNCQRWNMLYFLWGVFRGRRKENGSNPVKNNEPLPSNRESSIDRETSKTQSYLKEENGEKDEAKNVEEAEEGEIGVVVSKTHLKDEKNKTERIVFPLDLNDRKEEEEDDDDDDAMEVDNNNNNNPSLELALGEEKTGGVVLPFMARATNSIEEHRSCSSNNNNQMGKNQEAEDDEDDAASLSLSLSFSSLEQEKKQQKQKQDVNTPLFLFRDFPDKSSSSS